MRDEPEELKLAYALYEQSDYLRALDVLKGSEDKYPDWRGRILEVLMDLYAVSGSLEQAEDILSQALEEGFFFSEAVLRDDSDVHALQERPRFEALAARSSQMMIDAQSFSKPQLLILEQRVLGKEETPLFIGLHGNHSHARGFSIYWDSLVRSGWLVALPQSSQVSSKGLYVWNDFNRIEKEIPEHYQVITQKYTIDPKRTIIGGFSKGGHAAIHTALKGEIPVSGFILMAPYIPSVDLIEPLLKANDLRHLRGYFLLGELDEHCTPGALRLRDRFTEYGIQCELEIFSGLAHDLPDDFDTVLERAIQYVINE